MQGMPNASRSPFGEVYNHSEGTGIAFETGKQSGVIDIHSVKLPKNLLLVRGIAFDLYVDLDYAIP
jgi:hypothetical protein